MESSIRSMQDIPRLTLSVTDIKKNSLQLYNEIIIKYGGRKNVFDATAAILMHNGGIEPPRCDVCNSLLTITKKFRNFSKLSKLRCAKHVNTNNAIKISNIKEKNVHKYTILSYPSNKVLTLSDKITVQCSVHKPYEVQIGNFIKGMQCQKCYHKSMAGKKNLKHTTETKKFLSNLKTNKPVFLSDESKNKKAKRQREAWERRKADIANYEKYISMQSNRQKEYVKRNGPTFPAKQKTGLETKVENFLKNHNIRYICQFLFFGKRFDFFLIDMNLLLEVDGEYWHRLKSSIKNDIEKHVICRENNMQLLRISSDNFNLTVILASKQIQEEHTMKILKLRNIDGF